MGIYDKPIYREELPKKPWLEQFADLKGGAGAWEKKGVGWYPNAHYEQMKAIEQTVAILVVKGNKLQNKMYTNFFNDGILINSIVDFNDFLLMAYKYIHTFFYWPIKHFPGSIKSAKKL